MHRALEVTARRAALWIGCAAAACGSSQAAAAACPRAVLFDLGNTLVASGPGGQFVLRAGAQQAVDELQAAGVKLGVITNVPNDWTRATLAEIANLQTNPTSGARAAGMIGIHLSDAAPSPSADFTLPFNGLTQIPGLIAGLCDVFGDGFETAP